MIADEIAVASAEVEGQFDQPSLRGAKGMAVAGEGEQFDLTGSWDFRRQEILAAPCRGRFGGQRWPAERGPWRDHDVGQHQSVPSRQQAFFPGGDGSTRGYRSGEASPRGAAGRFIGVQSDLTGTVKFEQALVRKWSLVVFADVRGTATQLRKYPFDTLLYAAGGGVRYLTLIGPIRVEYGHNLNPRPDDPAGAWMLSIGFPF